MRFRDRSARERWPRPRGKPRTGGGIGLGASVPASWARSAGMVHRVSSRTRLRVEPWRDRSGLEPHPHEPRSVGLASDAEHHLVGFRHDEPDAPASILALDDAERDVATRVTRENFPGLL